jgi:hypothetical protein
MKKILLTLTAFAVTSASMAQTVYFEDFDSYTAGDYVATQATEWTTWTNSPGGAEDAFISTEQASSGANSIKLESATGSGPTDLVLPFGDITEGDFALSMKMYVVAGSGGYFNLQHFSTPGQEWACEVYFGDAGSGMIYAGGDSAVITHTNDAWFDVTITVDLDTDIATFIYGTTPLLTWDFSLDAQGAAGTSQVGGMNVFAAAPTGLAALFYIDDVGYTHLSGVGVDENEAADFVTIFPNPSNGLVNIEMGATSKTTTYRVYDIAGKVVATDVLTVGTQTMDLTNLNSGMYILEVQQGAAIQTERIVLK